MSVHKSAAAVVLCGGRSVRMGTDKSELLIEGESFLSRICRIVGPCVETTVVVAAQDQSLPELPTSVGVVRDALPDAGPLVGLLSGFEDIRSRQPHIQHCWVGNCDAPFVNSRLIGHLLQMCGDNAATVVRYAGRIQPLGGVYHIRVLETVRRLVDSGERRLNQLLQHVQTEVIDAEALRKYDPELTFLRNVNTPEDYQRYVVDQ
jgi:molybdopterin-guanine dinucleotide biosynthesis protein A